MEMDLEMDPTFRLFKRFLKIIAIVYTHQFAKFCDLMSCSSTDIQKYTLSYALILTMMLQIW